MLISRCQVGRTTVIVISAWLVLPRAWASARRTSSVASVCAVAGTASAATSARVKRCFKYAMNTEGREEMRKSL